MARKPTRRARDVETRPLTVLLTEPQFDAVKAAADAEDRAMSRYVARLVMEDLLHKKFIAYEDAYPEVAKYLGSRKGDDDADDASEDVA